MQLRIYCTLSVAVLVWLAPLSFLRAGFNHGSNNSDCGWTGPLENGIIGTYRFLVNGLVVDSKQHQYYYYY